MDVRFTDSALLADWAEEPTAIPNVDADNCRARIVAAVESVEAEIARLVRRFRRALLAEDGAADDGAEVDGEICRDCMRPVVDCVGSYWNAPNEIWNEVWGDEGGILCPRCFVARADALGFCIAFRAYEFADRRKQAEDGAA